MSATTCPSPAFEAFATLRKCTTHHACEDGATALSLLQLRMDGLTAELAESRAEALRLYCESWGMAVKVAEVRELLAEEAFSADVLRMAKELAAQQRARAELAEGERDTLRERLAAVETLLAGSDARESALKGQRDTVCSEAEVLADSLDREQRAHEQTRHALVQASRELEWLRSVETASRAVLGVCDAATEAAQTEERLEQLGAALDSLRAAVSGAPLPPALEMIANLIMLASLRAGAQGRDFNAYEAATLVEAYLRGEQGQPRLGLGMDSLRYQLWLQQWTDAGAAAREAQTTKALTDAGVPTGVSTRPGWVSHLPADRVRWLSATHLRLLEQLDEWKAASGLEVGGDPGGVEPQHLHKRWAELYGAAAPFLQLARDRLARRSWEPIPDADCQRFLTAFDDEGPLQAFPAVVGVDLASGPDIAVMAPPEAFTAEHALEPDMPGLPGGEDVDNG